MVARQAVCMGAAPSHSTTHGKLLNAARSGERKLAPGGACVALELHPRKGTPAGVQETRVEIYLDDDGYMVAVK